MSPAGSGSSVDERGSHPGRAGDVPGSRAGDDRPVADGAVPRPVPGPRVVLAPFRWAEAASQVTTERRAGRPPAHTRFDERSSGTGVSGESTLVDFAPPPMPAPSHAWSPGTLVPRRPVPPGGTGPTPSRVFERPVPAPAGRPAPSGAPAAVQAAPASSTRTPTEAGLPDTVGPAGDDRQPSAPEGGASTIAAAHVSCWFGSRQVLQDVNLVMPPSQITALIGPSGCGKSTFLRSLNRMHELVPGASLSGSIRLDGEEIYGSGARPTEVRARIGMVFQRPNPFPAMSIAENVLAGLRLAGRHVGDEAEILETSLRRAGLWNEAKDRLTSSGASLSGGQQQRLCIARAIAVGPRVLLMDEPCSALDPISTAVIEDTMLSLKHEVTIVIVTHNMQQASRVSDQCALFLVDAEDEPGHIVEAGPTTDIFSHPRDSRTLDYISGRFG